jgi:hypothetical protein
MRVIERMGLRRGLVVTSICALAIGAAACGGDDDGGEGGNASAEESKAPAVRFTGTGPEQDIYRQYVAFTGAIESKEPKAVCATMSPRMQAEIGLGEAGACVTKMKEHFAAGAGIPQKKEPPQTVESIEKQFEKLDINGAKARAVVRSRLNENSYLMEFAKVDGQWKFHGDGNGPVVDRDKPTQSP